MISDVSVLVRTALSDALMILLPVSCAGCDQPDAVLCEHCAAALAPAPTVRWIDAPDGSLPVWSGLAFDGVVARVVRAVKEDGRTGLARSLAPALAAAFAAAVPSPDDRRGILVVPVPTSRAAYRRRGFRVPDLVAARAGMPMSRGLRQARRTGDQRGLDRDERRRNVERSLVATGLAGRRVVIVDDVVTTGATLAEAARALSAGGADVAAALTVAATPRRERYTRDGDRDASETHR